MVKMKGEKTKKRKYLIKRKMNNLWIIDRAVLNQMKYQKSETSRQMGNILDFPTSKDDPSMSYIMKRLKSAKLLKYNKQSKKYSLTELGKTVEKQI